MSPPLKVEAVAPSGRGFRASGVNVRGKTACFAEGIGTGQLY
jgi:hypothetical protein